MGLLERIKSALGFESSVRTEHTGSSPGAGSDQDVAVTVEHEPDTTAEDAVKGTDTEAERTPGSDGTSAAETEAVDDTEPQPQAETETRESAPIEDAEIADTEPEREETEAQAEPATGDLADVEEGEPEAGETEAVSEQPTTTSAESPDVQTINGIGPAYAERLAEADVLTVADLAAADAETVAETTGIAQSRVATWIERAGE